MSIAETDRLNEFAYWIDLEFVQRERTLRKIVEKGIRHHLAEPSPLDTVSLLED